MDADYTSQGCPNCGNVEVKNCPKQGLGFRGTLCGFTLHADLVGARNVTPLSGRTGWGRAVCQPALMGRMLKPKLSA